jgi:hypothetical protein
MGGIALIVTSLQLRLRHRNKDQKVYKLLKAIVNILFCKISKPKDANPDANMSLDGQKSHDLDQNEKVDHVTWNDVSSAIDCVMFVISFLVYVISTVCVMGILQGGN